MDTGISAIRQLVVSAISMLPDPSMVTPLGALSSELAAVTPLFIPTPPVGLPATV